MEIRMKKAWIRKVSILVSIILMLSLTATAFAETTQQKLDQAQQEQAKTQENLDDTKDNLSSLKGTRNALQNELNNLNEELDAASANLEDLETQIENKQADITQTEIELMNAEKTEQEQYEAMLVRIRFMYENADATTLEMLFTANSFADFLNKNEYIEKVEAYDRKKLEEYKETCELVSRKKESLEQQLLQLQTLREEAEAEQSRVSQLVSKTADSVAAYGDQISDTQAQMIAYEEKLKQQNDEIEKLKAQIEEEKRLAALAAQSAKRDISSVVFDENDKYLLANLIYCEAGNQPYAGKVAVGAVVINRLLSSVFPNTITGVIYQKNQFSPVKSGRYALALANNSATTSCYQAADAAMAGETTVADCLFFRTPVDYIEPRYRIGGHIFY